jgi:hypothetical protein
MLSDPVLDDLFKMRNSTQLRVRTKTQGDRDLSPAEILAFDQLRRGHNSGTFFLQKNKIMVLGGSNPGFVVVSNSGDNLDKRPKHWWWKDASPKQALLFDQKFLYQLSPERAQVANFEFFKEYNKYPFRAIRENNVPELIGRYFVVNDNGKLTYQLQSGSEWEVVSVSNATYLKTALQNMQKLRGVYDEDFEFPEWSIQTVTRDYHRYMAATRVFYRSDSRLEDVQLLAREREPVNITMERHYDQNKMQNYFGWKIGAYARMTDPPNFAIYTLASVKIGNHFQDVHILHAIGLAFDHADQEDYKKYMGLPVEKRRPAVVEFYKRMFRTVFQACEYLQFNTLVMSLVGANNFATLYKDEWVNCSPTNFQAQIWLPTWANIAKEYPNIQVKFMGAVQNTLGYFPDCVTKLPEALYVNAWDCWSIVGNGNKMDRSLDGFVGRSSSAAVASWPLTNMYMHDGNYIALE